MTLILELPPETEIRLREDAAREGREIADYLLERATEKLLSLEEAGERLDVDTGYVENLTRLELLDFRMMSGQKLISEADLARYQKAVRENPDKAMDEMVGMNQLLGLYDDDGFNPMIKL